MFRIILFIIAIYVVAKIVGLVLNFLRIIAHPDQRKRTPPPQAPRGSSKIPYSNVEDVDYEDISDKP